MTSAGVILVSPDELEKLVEAALRRVLAERRVDDGCDWVDAAGAAAILGVHVRTIGNFAKRRDLPSTRVGRLLRFKRADLLEYLAAGAR